MKAQDLLHDGILKSIVLFSIPLLAGNLFQQLYNTVDSYVVGNYVSMEALAAVGQSTPIINMLVGFFMGLSIGAGVVIAQYFGANKIEKLQQAIHTSLALTFVLCIIFTICGIWMSHRILIMIGSPEEVMVQATTYLQIYFLGISFSLIYNMASGILRALGDSKNPLIYLAIASILNIILDFIFVLYLDMSVAGVAIATNIAQAVSALLVMIKLVKTEEIYKVSLSKIRFHKEILMRIISIGIPAALQNSIVSFSNVIVQSYISGFGASAVAGYSTTVKLDGFMQLPVQSFSMAITTFVGQNYGAGQMDRVRKSLYYTLAACFSILIIGGFLMFKYRYDLISVFTDDPETIVAGSKMIMAFAPMYCFVAACHITAGALRGVGASKVPMYSMIFCFVFLRQIYLYFATQYFPDLYTVFLGWPLTWIVNALFLSFFYYKYTKYLS